MITFSLRDDLHALRSFDFNDCGVSRDQLLLHHPANKAIAFRPVSFDEAWAFRRIVERLANRADALGQGLIVDVMPFPELVQQFAASHEPVMVFDQIQEDLKWLAG